MNHLDYNNILLVHPLGYKTNEAARDVSRLANIMPPIGLASMAAYLDNNGIDSEIIDCYAYPEYDTPIRKYLLEKRPAYIGFSCTTSSFFDGIRTATMAKEILPGIKVIFGGAHVSALRLKILNDFPVIDYCVTGEGEATLTELIQSRGEDSRNIEGLVYRADDQSICVTPNRSKLLDLDTLPFPAYEKLKGYPDAYKLPIFNYPKTPNTSCISSRGCPYSCSYCDRSVFKKSFRFNSAEYLYEHLRYLKKRFGIRHINFYDDQFTFNRKRVEDFTQLMLKKPLSMTFNCAVRAEHIDTDLIHMMKKAGCWMISLGIESGDPELLTQHRKNVDLDMMRQKIHMIKQAGIRTKGLFMVGLPGETEESMKKSIRFYKSLPIDELNVAKFTPFPGTPLYENLNLSGEFKEDWEKMDCMNFLFVPNGLSVPLMEKYFIKFYQAHFMRNRTIWNYITMMWKSPDSWKRFLYDLKGFMSFVRSNKRFS